MDQHNFRRIAKAQGIGAAAEKSIDLLLMNPEFDSTHRDTDKLRWAKVEFRDLLAQAALLVEDADEKSKEYCRGIVELIVCSVGLSMNEHKAAVAMCLGLDPKWVE